MQVSMGGFGGIAEFCDVWPQLTYRHITLENIVF